MKLSITVAVLYFYFGWHYGDAVLRRSKIDGQRLAHVVVLLFVLFWPLWLLMRAATKLAEW